MDFSSSLPPATDRRVRRSRAALIDAAIELVGRHGTAAVALSDLAAAADVGRKVAYQQFGDRDTLLLEAALDLLRRDVVPQVINLPAGRPRAVATYRHFALHRNFYRALLTSPSAHALSAGIGELLLPRTEERIRYLYGDDLDAEFVSDLAVQLHGGMMAMLVNWLLDDEDGLGPEEFADRTLRVQYFLIPEGEPFTERNALAAPLRHEP
jgi:AcrR family transcriptional regulator